MRAELQADVIQLLQERRGETDRLEYKGALAPVDEQRFRATVCAFANDLHNRNGGIIIVGVAEQEGRPVTPPQGVDDPDRVQRRIVELCHDIRPTYLPRIEVIGVDGRTIVAVRCPPGDGRPYTAADRNGHRVPWVRVGPVTKPATGPLEAQLREVSARIPFDERVRSDLTTESLSLPMLVAHLRAVHSKRADDPTPTPRLFEVLDLACPSNGHVSPRNVALMFFTPRTAEWFPGGQIEISVHASDTGPTSIQRLPPIDGPLPEQIRGALRALQPYTPTRITKRTDRPESDIVYAWPPEAIEEAISNAVYHRGYDDPNPTRVIVSAHDLRITSYPGPVAGLRHEDLTVDDRPMVPQRNRRIRDLLRDLGLVEAEGTGIRDIRRAMARNGSPPPRFDFDEGRTFFEVRLPKHPAFIERRGQPLRVGMPCPPDELVGRDAFIQHLWRVLDDESATLLGHGRGSTSLFMALEAAPPPGWDVVRVDAADQPRDDLVRWTTEHLQSTGRRLWIIDHANSASIESLLADLARRDRVLTDASVDSAPPFATLVLPPLDAAATRELADRLLAGAGLEPAQDALDALTAACAGLPRVLTRLVLRLKRDGHPPTAASVSEALEDLLAQRGDPTGLVARSSPDPWSWSPILALVPDGGIRRTELLSARQSGGVSRVGALGELTRQLESGVLVEVDDVVRFEHPVVAATHSRDAALGDELF